MIQNFVKRISLLKQRTQPIETAKTFSISHTYTANEYKDNAIVDLDGMVAKGEYFLMGLIDQNSASTTT